MKLETAISKLYSLQKFGIKLGLKNIEKFLELLQNPQKDFKSFHIAGSNGKGSTASFIASILTEAGFKVGLYTSPHFVRFNERVKIKNFEISDDYIIGFISKYFSYIEQEKLTFFEATTALAFKYFSDNKIDYGVIETGLGGRLDATNVINPLASIITSISYEHTEILGETLELIAEEKAGIIKRGCKVFIGRLPLEAEKVIERKCDEFSVELFKISKYGSNEIDGLKLDFPKLFFENLPNPLLGEFQKYNAALAILTVSESLEMLDKNLFKKGIDKVIPNTGLQGRYEIINENPKVIFDSAHNVEGVENFISTFASEASNYEKRVLLFGAMRDKAIRDMLSTLNPYFTEIHFTDILLDRCATIEQLSEIALELNLKCFVETDVESFISDFIKTKNNHCLVVLGSIYILGFIKEKLLTKKTLDIIS
ncbi:MAG: bifunctional folylpolyglutamate synthase/dihydrofolate synthase [Ignavibacteriales bacterium]|nr:bifunctional folylpolyglutamate synthase/dihydrofolate synthase [Ignavibacteriales bacterium]